LFLLIIAAAAAFRLLGWTGAVLAAAVILLTHQSPAPRSGCGSRLFVAVALLRFVPEGRLRAWVGRYQFVSLVALGFVLIAFSVQQYRFALHPQLMQAEYGGEYGLAATVELQRPAAIMLPEVAMDAAGDAAAPAEEVVVRESSVPSPAVREDRRSAQASRALRSGRDAANRPGIPNWSYLTYSLRWSGPVDEKRIVRLAIVPPLLLSLWRILGVLAATALLLALVKLAYGVPTSGACRRGGRVQPLVYCWRCSHGFAPRAHAQAPDRRCSPSSETSERAGEVSSKLRRSGAGDGDRQRRSTRRADGSARTGECSARHPASGTAVGHRSRHRR
jgi:hypothetical protein